MRWRRSPGQDSGIEDRRGARGGMSGGRIAGGTGRARIGRLSVALLVVFLGGGGGRAFDIGPDLEPFPTAPAAQDSNVVQEGQDPLKEFVGFVITDVNDAWTAIFASAGRQYERTRLVLFTSGV